VTPEDLQKKLNAFKSKVLMLEELLKAQSEGFKAMPFLRQMGRCLVARVLWTVAMALLCDFFYFCENVLFAYCVCERERERVCVCVFSLCV